MTPEETLDWLAQQHFDQCREERPIQDWIRKMKSQLPVQPAAVVEPHMSEQHKQRSVSEHLEPVEDLQAKLKWATEQLEANINWEFVAAAKEEMLKAAWAEIKELREQIKEPAVAEQHKQEPTNNWSEWRGMVVQNLIRHGIDKDFARRLAHFYQDKAPQPKEPEQEPLEYWNAVEGWVKIDEVREHFDSVGCGTIYKTSGEGRVPLSLWKAQPEQKPAYSSCFRCVTPKKCSVYGCCPNTWPSENATPPQRKPLTDEMVVAAARVLNERQADACGVDRDDQWAIYSDDFKADALAMLKAAHGIKE